MECGGLAPLWFDLRRINDKAAPGRRTPKVRMKLAFSTLGCPDWELPKIIAAAREWGYEAVELRALGGSLDLLDRREFSKQQIARTRFELESHGIAICCVDTSCTFHSPDASERAAQVQIALAHAELAAQLGAPIIRVFPIGFKLERSVRKRAIG